MTTIDADLGTPIFSKTCTFCTHWQGDIRRCDAFPEPGSVPMEIWMGKNDHHQPYPGDHGIRFTALPPAS